MKSLTILFILLTLACSKFEVKNNSPTDKVFPSGVYHHDVTLTVRPGNNIPDKTYNFSGIVRLSETEIIVVALSYFGLTEFKIHEDLKTAQIDTQINQDALKKFEPQIRSYYGLLRQGLLKKKTDAIENATFKFEDYDKNGIPLKFQIEHPQFTVKVKVTSYEI